MLVAIVGDLIALCRPRVYSLHVLLTVFLEIRSSGMTIVSCCVLIACSCPASAGGPCLRVACLNSGRCLLAQPVCSLARKSLRYSFIIVLLTLDVDLVLPDIILMHADDALLNNSV